MRPVASRAEKPDGQEEATRQEHHSPGSRATGEEFGLAGFGRPLDAAPTNWPHILMMYRLCAAKKPVMLYDSQEARVYAYPYLEFKQELSERSQQTLTSQYEWGSPRRHDRRLRPR